MRILIIADETWNDEEHGNNVLTNWFLDFPADIYMISCSPGKMMNKVCKNYFQITDKMMFKSLFTKEKAGKILKYKDFPISHTQSIDYVSENKKAYKFLKKITTEFLRNVRELIWLYGKYDTEKLYAFLDEANPDIIFSARKATAKLLRLEKFIKLYTRKPLVAYTGDNECAIDEKYINIFKIIRINRIRKMMDKQVPTYDLYYMHSEEQARQYNEKYGISTKVLQKCGDFSKEMVHEKINNPIKIVYAGKLYCKRWKTLGEVEKALKSINKEKILMTLDIYTMDKLNKKKMKLLDDGKSVFLHPPVQASRLKNIYDNSDIVLHVESFETKYMALTKYSFSTKIIDCLASGCAIMAICGPEQAGFKYLREQEAAITIDSINDIEKTLRNLTKKTEIIKKYAISAYKCGTKYHQKNIVQKSLLNDFERIIKNNSVITEE